MEELAGALPLVAHGRDGALQRTSPVTRLTSARRGSPERATILAQVRAGTPVAVARASGASSIPRLASRTLVSSSGGVSRASLRGRLLRSDIGSPRRARASHFEAVWRLTPIWRVTSETRSPPATRETSVSRPRGVSLALGCCHMGGPPRLQIQAINSMREPFRYVTVGA